MKKIAKLIFVLLLIVVLCIGTVGCRTKNVSGEIELNWWYCGNGIQKDTELVEQEFNRLLKTYPGMENITIRLKSSAGNDHTTAVPLALSAGEQIDILNTQRLQFSELVEDGTLIPIDGYLKNQTELQEIIPEWLWDSSSINGQVYMVPNYQRASNMNYLVFPKVYADKYEGFDKLRQVLGNSESTMDEIAVELEKALIAIRENEGNTKYMIPFGNLYLTSMGVNEFYDSIHKSMVVYDGTDKVVNMYLNENAKKAYDYSAEWFKKGYVPIDILTMNVNDLSGKNMLNSNSFIFTVVNFIGDEKTVSEAYKKTYGFDVYALPVKNQYYIANTWPAGGHGVTSLCKHPQEAVDFLNLLYSAEGKELYNLLVYGIEGKHYEKLDDNHIRTYEYDTAQAGVSTSYGAYKWNMGNAFNAYLNQGCVDGENELSIELNNSDETIKSKLMGFSPKIDAIDTEIAQINAVSTEFAETLKTGVLGDGWKDYYTQYETKMKQAGIDKVTEELQKQVDAFLVNK